MNNKINKIVKIISNPKMFVFTIIWLMVLVFFGTIEQKYIGLFAAQNKYFLSTIIWFYALPLPGGLLTMSILSINLFRSTFISVHVCIFKFKFKSFYS